MLASIGLQLIIVIYKNNIGLKLKRLTYTGIMLNHGYVSSYYLIRSKFVLFFSAIIVAEVDISPIPE